MMVGISLFQKLANHITLVQRSAPPSFFYSSNFKSRHQTPGVQSQELGRFVVGVDFDVLVRDFLLFEDEPDALHERAEPA